MQPKTRYVHILDDFAMGGVTRALKNFEHPELQVLGTHEVVDISRTKPKALSPSDVAIIHFTANWRKLPTLLGFRLRRTFSRVILIEHTYTQGFEASEVSNSNRFHRMLRYSYDQVDTVVAVSIAQKRWIVSNGLAGVEKVVAIPQSRECRDLLSIPTVQRDGGPLRIGAFGRFHKQKGFDILLDAMKHVSPRVARLQIAGSGPDESTLKLHASNLCHVDIVDPFTSPKQFLSEIDVVAIPSRWEAFGLVGTEARAAGRPIITSHIDGLVDQLDKASFSHVCGDEFSLADAIHAAANARDLGERGQIVRAKATAEFAEMIRSWIHHLTYDDEARIAA